MSYVGKRGGFSIYQHQLILTENASCQTGLSLALDKKPQRYEAKIRFLLELGFEHVRMVGIGIQT